MNNNPPFISVVIPAFNESRHIANTINSLKNCEYSRKSFEIIVVDNNSTDGTKEIADKFADHSLILKDGNVGAVRNYGAKHARGEILAFLDADCIVSKDWLSNIAKLIEARPTGAFGGTCTTFDETNWMERYWLLGNGKKRQNALVGATIGIKRSVFWQVNGFDERITSGEDTDLSNKLKAHKIPINITQKLSVKHAGNANTPLSFIRRQIWHSENYLLNPKSAIKDPTFLLCLITLMSVFSIPYFAAKELIQPAMIASLTTLSVPAIFSAKRMLYAQYV